MCGRLESEVSFFSRLTALKYLGGQHCVEYIVDFQTKGTIDYLIVVREVVTNNKNIRTYDERKNVESHVVVLRNINDSLFRIVTKL